jgi:hypothetical protein
MHLAMFRRLFLFHSAHHVLSDLARTNTPVLAGHLKIQSFGTGFFFYFYFKSYINNYVMKGRLLKLLSLILATSTSCNNISADTKQAQETPPPSIADILTPFLKVKS